MTSKEILTLKLSKLNITLEDAELDLLLGEVGQVIKNYCNINEVPDELVYTVANMAFDLARYENELYKPDDEVEVSYDNADSIKVGDTTVSLKGGNNGSQRSKLLNSHSTKLDSIIYNYHEQLNKFRRMVW